jgi:imidazolonepropionase-like amidohydrolase
MMSITLINLSINMKKFINFLLACGVSATAYAQPPSPAHVQKLPILIEGATLHIGNGQVIENGEIQISNGKITYIGAKVTDLTKIENYEVIHATGKHIYPSLILMNSGLGLNEVEAVRATQDNEEVGDFNPHVRSLIAYNTDSELIPVTRSNGILLAQVAPHGGIFSGTSSVVQLDAWNWEDAAYKTDDGIYVDFPSSVIGVGRWEGGENVRRVEAIQEKYKLIENFLQDALNYSKIAQPSPVNHKLAAMKGLFDGTKRLYIRSNFAKDMMTAVQMFKKFGIQNITIVGGAEAYRITDFLKANNVSVVLNQAFRLPDRMDDSVESPYKNAAMLQKAGVLFTMAYNTEDASVRNSRNLPFAIGMACGFGLDKEQAISAVTMNAAKILGIDDRTGTLEKGKDANLVMSNGDILDIRSNHITLAIVQGRIIDLDNKQKRLHKKFMDRYIHQNVVNRE